MAMLDRRRRDLRGVGSGLACHVGELLGAGGQGEVYRATIGGRPVALKWYFRRTATAAQRQGLARLIALGPPDGRFLWPEELVASRDSFGYVMALREPRFKSLVDLMTGRIDPSFRAILTAAFQLADSFLALHARGQCYRDISFGNVFFEPQTGEIRVCDNDNVGTDGADAGGVVGTPRFMAPEVVCGRAQPSSHTDLWSLAVLLFYMLMVHHPLEGAYELAIKCMDLPAMTRLYGERPLFVFDPSDRRNAPVAGVHDNVLAFWPLYPERLRRLFTQTFTDGIRAPKTGRARESEWRAALVAARDALLVCQGCRAECFWGHPRCWACGVTLKKPFRMAFGTHEMALNADTRLFGHHVDPARRYEFGGAVAAVTRHPTDPSVFGLKNLSDGAITARRPDGSMVSLAPGRSVRLQVGLRVFFGASEGEVLG